MDFFKKDMSDRPVLLIPVSRAEKLVYALCGLAVLVSIVVAVLAVAYLPAKPVVQMADGSGANVRDKYLLAYVSVMVLGATVLVAVLPGYPLHRSNYFVKITPENAEAQYKLGRFVATCLYTSLAWWFAAAQAVSYVEWLGGREIPSLTNAVLIPMTLLPAVTIVYGVVMSWKRK